ALKYRVLPPTANYAAPGSHLGIEDSPFRVLTEPEPWESPAGGRPRRAAVSGFGFGGVKAHALIEEWVPSRHTASKSRTTVPAADSRPVPVAVVGLGAHFGPFRGLQAVQERMLGGKTAATGAPGPAPPPNDWGVFASDWARREGL